MPDIFHAKAENVQPGQQHVFIAIPVGAPADAALTAFMWETRTHLAAKGIACDLFILAGHCHVDDSRNYLVWEFLRTPCTDFLFIDADTCSSEDAVARILSFDRDVIAGLYPYKGDKLDFPVRMLDYSSPPVYEADGCIEIDAAPTGFLRIRRAAMERVERSVPGFWNKEVTRDSGERPVPLIFERTLEINGEFEGRPIGDRWGGDYSFCKKWRALGGKVYADPTLGFRHYGTKAYAGRFDVHVAQARGAYTPAFSEAVEALRGGWPMAAHFGRLLADWGNEYSARADLQSAAYWVAREADGPILETGSGLSTVVLGIAAELAGVQVYALEHDPDHYRRTVAALKRYGLGNVRLHYAPLRRHEYEPGRTCLWYEIPADLPEQFAMVLCDGPQQRFGRDGLLKVVGPRVAGAKILMDDAGTDLTATVALRDWSKESGRKYHVIESGERPFAVSVPGEVTAEAA